MSLQISDEMRCEILFEISKTLEKIYVSKKANEIYNLLSEYDVLSLIDDAIEYGLQDD